MRIIIGIILVLHCTMGFSQNDSSEVLLPHKKPSDTLSKTSTTDSTSLARPTERNPRRAALMSAALPGLGQIYNKSYWKLPIVYAGLGTAGYFYFNNRRYYNELKAAYLQDLATDDGDVSTYYDQGYTLTDIQSAAEQYQTWMEYSAVAIIAAYILQVVDASVDAHLYYFDVSEDLSLQWSPTLQYSIDQRPVNSLGIQLTF